MDLSIIGQQRETMAALESYPHIIQRMVLFWRAPEAGQYIDNLLLSERCDRHGFPPDAIDELMMLQVLCEWRN